jgi:hypothetical protein
MKSLVIVLIIAAALCSSLQAEGLPFPNVTPTGLFMHLDGFQRPQYSVELREGLVVYKHRVGTESSIKTVSIRPSKEAWSRFIKEINASKLYRWTKLYADWDVQDGTHWSMDLVIDGRKIHSEGYNNYPLDGSEAKPANSPEGSVAFDRLCLAVSHLIGQEFR